MSKVIHPILWCIVWLLANELVVNGMNLERVRKSDGNDIISQEPEAKIPVLPKPKRPVLVKGSFGYAHAHHLSQYDGNSLNVTKEEYQYLSDDRDGQQMLFRSFRRTRPQFRRRPIVQRPKFQPQKPKVQLQNPNPELKTGMTENSTENSETNPLNIKGACNDVDIVCDPKDKFRTPDGRCNNLQKPTWGKSETAYRRILPRKKSLAGVCSNGEFGSSRLPNARLVSRKAAERLVDTDARDNRADRTAYTVFWGQVIDHDMLLTPLRKTEDGEFLDCCDSLNLDAPECCSIKAPAGDFFYGRNEIPRCIPFIRSKLTEKIPDGCGETAPFDKKIEHVQDVENGNTHFLDCSHVYGSTKEIANGLRSFESGKLKSTPDRQGRHWPPLSQDGGAIRMEFGDTRGDVHPGFTMLVTMQLRYHNKIAEQLAVINPDWDDERLYQESRKIVTAMHQHITYTQWADSLLGTHDLRTNDRKLHEDFYLAGTDPTISAIFATSAFRLHTLVPGSLQKRNNKYQFAGKLHLRDAFHQPLKLLENTTCDDLIRGLAWQPAWDFNNLYSEDMTEMLFAEENNGSFGMDIISLNVQRGRDHMIPGYTAYREACGFNRVTRWSDLTTFIPKKLVERLVRIYKRPEDVDMYIAANMERRIEGSLLGPTIHCLVEEQFARTRDGDRHFYTRPSEFNQAQLSAIKKAGSLSHMLCNTADVPKEMWLPKNMFQLDLKKNPLIPCSKFPFIDLKPWSK